MTHSNTSQDPAEPGQEGADEDKPTCLDSYTETTCGGAVEYRFALSATGKSFPRCDRHWNARLDREERLRRDYPDSSTPPSWFDPTFAGETWNDED